MVRIIQVGLGRWGFNWASSVVPSVEGAETVAYVDAAPQPIARVQSELKVDPKKCFSSLADALKAVECDLVLATLRTEAHFPVVRDVLLSGHHVVVEKPFASSIAQAKELVALASERKRILMVSQNYRYYPAPILATELLAKQELGPLNAIGIDFRRHAPTQGHNYPEIPDPLLADMSIHHFDLMRLVLGDEPTRVSCRTWAPHGTIFTNPAAAIATIEFSRGTLVSYRGSWVSGGPRTPWSGEWTMDCAAGEIVWTSRDEKADKDKTDRLEVYRLGKDAEAPALPRLKYVDRAGSLAAAMEAVTTGKLPPRFPSGADNIGSLALVAANILSASRGGAWVEIAEVLA
jgi:predicted dehydrogenase